MLSSYSHNSLDTFQTCPRKYKFQYVEKVDIPSRVPADLYLGNAVHQTLRQLYERVADGVGWPLEDMLAYYEAEWEKPARKEIEIIKDYMTVDDYIRNGRAMLSTYYHKYSPFTDGTLLGVELNLSMMLPDTHFRIKGRIDRLWKRPDGVIEICDYKTGGFLPRAESEQFLSQMGLYHLLVKENYRQFARVVLAQYYLKSDEVVSRELSEDQLDELAMKIRGEILDTIEAEKTDNFPTREGTHCNYCDFAKLCPAKRHRQILDSEAGKLDGVEKKTALTASELAEQFLEADRQKKELEARHDALKQDLIQIARDMKVDKLEAPGGTISIKITREERFPTKSKDMEQFTSLSELARRMQLETCFTLDTVALRDLYIKQRLPDELLRQLGPFVQVVESSRVSPRHKKIKDEDLED